MQTIQTSRLADTGGLTDGEIVDRVLAGERALFELLMRRYNQRVYRTVRGLLKDESEVEEVMQQAYVSAYVHLRQFQAASSFSTWLVRIALNEALARLRRGRRLVSIETDPASEETPMHLVSDRPDPEQTAHTRELMGLVQEAVDALPDLYRSVLVLREVEGLSTSDTAEALGVSQEVVKTRLHRARAAMEQHLSERARQQLSGLFSFHAPRCDRVVSAVLDRIASLEPGGS